MAWRLVDVRPLGRAELSSPRVHPPPSPPTQPRGISTLQPDCPPTCVLILPPAPSTSVHLILLRLPGPPSKGSGKTHVASGALTSSPSEPTRAPGAPAPLAPQPGFAESPDSSALKPLPPPASLLSTRVSERLPSCGARSPSAPRASLPKQRACIGGCGHAGGGLRPAPPGPGARSSPPHAPQRAPRLPGVDLVPALQGRERAGRGARRAGAPPGDRCARPCTFLRSLTNCPPGPPPPGPWEVSGLRSGFGALVEVRRPLPPAQRSLGSHCPRRTQREGPRGRCADGLGLPATRAASPAPSHFLRDRARPEAPGARCPPGSASTRPGSDFWESATSTHPGGSGP